MGVTEEVDAEEHALHSGRIGAATELELKGRTTFQIQRAERWKSDAFVVYVREAVGSS
ncbi:unnamed protein product [Discosporangium mesarthrocarpum]